jgi:hypothetical protein
MSLAVVYVQDYNHVLGALSVTGASPPTDAAALVGAELPLRTSLDEGRIATLPVDESLLAVAAANHEPAVFTEPFTFGVEVGADDKPKPVLRQLEEWTTELVLQEDGLVVTLPSPATVATPVLALVTDGQDVHSLSGVVAVEDPGVLLPVGLSKGLHGVLVLVAGLVVRLEGLELP